MQQKHLMKQLLSSVALVLVFTAVSGQKKAIPVTPNASAEAKALLETLYHVSGKYTLTGQHNYPLARDRNSQFAASYIGMTPAIWSTDFGFSEDGDQDSYLARPGLVQEAIRQHKLGSIITICWHAVPPTADEPITFRPAPGANPEALASVQGRLTDQQFKDVLTKGTALNKHWMAQVDTIAHYLKQLQDAHVPVLWRPYHEMNGDWFWWGNRVGEYSTAALYRQIFDRLANYHKLNNLIWVWSVDRPSRAGMEFTNFYPGDKYLDILALDVYGSDFNLDYYNGLLELSHGKPITLGEVGNPPDPDVIEQQPKWSYWVVWAGMVRNTSHRGYDEFIKDPRVLFMEDQAYLDAVAGYRATCGLPNIVIDNTEDFSGEWVLDEEKSDVGNAGFASVPSRLKIKQDGSAIDIERSFIVEWADNRTTHESLPLDGTETTSTFEFFNAPRITTAGLSGDGDTLKIHSKVVFNFGGQERTITTHEAWSLQQHRSEIHIYQSTQSMRGDTKMTLVYEQR